MIYFSLNPTTEMADLCFSISSMSQYYYHYYYSLVMLFSFIFSHHFYFSYLTNISLLLLPLIYHNFTLTFSQPAGSIFLLLPLIFPPTFSEHGSGFVAECEPLSEEINNNHFEDVHKIVKAEQESKLTTSRTVTLCGKSHQDFVKNDSNLRCTGQEEELWKSTLAWKLFEERHYNVVEGDQGSMDALWEAAFLADSIKSRRIDVVVKNKDIKKKSGELDKNNSSCNEDEDEEEQVEMTSGCLQGFKCCSTGTTWGKMNMKRGRISSIVKITKPLKFINCWRHFKSHTTRNRF